MTPPVADRWVEVSPSQFTHEAEGLSLVRNLLPDQPPFRAWSNFEFRDGRGRWHEVDLLVLGRRQLHLVELKYYSGRLRGDDHRWLRDGHRAEDSPLKLAHRKAQYLASKLTDEFHAWVRERKIAGAPNAREVVPFIQESVFLHHPQFRCELSEASTMGLYGLDGHKSETRLPGISELLLEPAQAGRQVREQVLVELMRRIGLFQRREREAGSWVIQGEPVAEGDGWQEWEASHKFVQTERARIRFQLVSPGASDSEQQRVRRIAGHEFQIMSRLSHEGLLRPRDLVESELGVGLVYPDEPDWQRLDLWLADQPQGVPLAIQLLILRQVGEAVQYAHANRVVHRGINPYAVWLRTRAGALKVQVRDWQSSGQVAAEEAASSAVAGVTALFDASRLVADDGDGWLRAFAAPEGALASGVDRIRVDVFGLGALAFYLLTRQPAARSAAALRDRLREQSGLDLAPELPQVSSALRTAVLNATRPAVSERTADVSTFLAELTLEEARETEHEPVVDPLEATPGAVLDGRFRLKRRLGKGSTAVGLLVTDLDGDPETERVLKVAVDDAGGQRLVEEAEVLRSLRNLHSPRIVAMVSEPLIVGGRQALLLESAGTDTLAQAMIGRPRLSLDLLERWGTDLLEAVVALDRAGVDHRDIKPANLGVRESRSNRAPHLVLFDFSLSRAAAAALRAGTPPYLDPFLGSAGRDRYDSAAERYAAAAVLFEMATGNTPMYGDGLSDPAVISDDATIRAEQFDPTVAQPLVTFFRQALARDVAERHHTAGEMLSAWQLTFSQTDTSAPDNAGELTDTATAETLLAAAGLSARALSALEPFAVTTVGDLVAVDAARLSRLSGVAEPTRNEVRRVASLWRRKYGTAVRRAGASYSLRDVVLPGPMDAADLLLEQARAGRARNRPALVSRILGLTSQVDAFATQANLGALLPDPVGAARVNQLGAELQEAWASHEPTRELLIGLGAELDDRLTALGGVATVDELVEHLVSRMVADPASDDAQETRLVAGLIRLVLDRQRALIRGQDEGVEYAVRRRGGRPVLLAANPDLLDVAEALGRAADKLILGLNPQEPYDAVVPPIRVTEALSQAVGGLADAQPALANPVRLAQLAAQVSTRAAASGIGELHHRELPAHRAIALALNAIAAGQKLPPTEIRERVRARFPSLAPLPERSRLDQVIDQSGLGLIYDERERKYRMPESEHDTTGLESRPPTVLITDAAPVSERGVIGQRLADSLARRSFLALGAPARSLSRLMTVLGVEYGATVINLSAVLIEAMREQASTVGLPWSKVRSADAQPPGSRDAQGVAALVERALPAVEMAIEAGLAQSGSGPLVLTDAAPLARYGAIGRLSRWTDLSTSKARALWLVLPQLHANQGPLLDQRPIPLAAPGQFVYVDPEWVAVRLRAVPPEGEEGATA
jgi:serine/threonine protein kinase